MAHYVSDTQIVEAILADTPDHAEGTRPVHAIGIACEGYFTPLEAARDYCIAPHFQKDSTPVTVRYSNGSGSKTEHDGWSDVRGMATRFHLPDAAPADLVAMTLGEFFVQDIDQFMAFTTSARPEPPKRESPWRKIWDMLNLRPPMPDPPPDKPYDNAMGLLQFAAHNRYADLAIFQVSTIGAPVSYARASYHAVNTFIAIGPDGRRRHVRFHWQPVAGVLNNPMSKPPVAQYLHQELRDRLAKWPARFILNMTIGEAGDALHDPTRPWPKRRTTIEMGTLTLTGVCADQKDMAEKIAFNPCRVPDGIELSADPILQARKGVYETSRKMRGGTACPFHKEAS